MDNKIPVFVYESNVNSLQVLKSYFTEFDLNIDCQNFDDITVLIEAVENSTTPPIVLIDISSKCAEYMPVIAKIKQLTPKIIVSSIDCSTDIMVQAMRNGAKEFLSMPIIKEDLKNTIERFCNTNFGEEYISSKIITIYSNKGGIGKTTIATNLAVELAKITHDKVALIDLNLQLGDISTFLNLNPTLDVAYVMKNLTDKKEDVLLKAFEKYKSTDLYVLSDPAFIEQSESITPQQIEKLFETIKKAFHYIVIDMSSAIDQNSLKILDKSDLILFTTIINIPAIRNAQRCLNLFTSRKYPKDKVKIIVNRYMENDEIQVNDIENTLGEKIYWKIPNNYFSIMEAINKGLPVSDVNSNSNISNNFRDLATKMSDEIVEETILKNRI
jgi:pilus assembly protein CpaE